MSARAKHPDIPAVAPVVLFGIDSSGKPKGARFGKDHAGLAIKAANQLQLRVLPSTDPSVADIVAQLPVGRVHATGKMFVPFIRRDLYDKIVAAAPKDETQQPVSPPPNSGDVGSKPPGSPANLPKTWQEIGIGHLVVAQETPEDGWYEAIVAETHGDTLTLRWRDYPRERRIVRHRNRLALLYPAAREQTGGAKSPKSETKTDKDKPTTVDRGANPQGLPADWQHIDVDCLVLAKSDSPWGSWCEAIPAEKAGDEFKLRWRDNHGNVPPITRSRYDLALLCPNAA